MLSNLLWWSTEWYECAAQDRYKTSSNKNTTSLCIRWWRKEEVYEEIIKYMKGDENLTLLGHWNAIAEEKVKDVTRTYGLGNKLV